MANTLKALKLLSIASAISLAALTTGTARAHGPEVEKHCDRDGCIYIHCNEEGDRCFRVNRIHYEAQNDIIVRERQTRHRHHDRRRHRDWDNERDGYDRDRHRHRDYDRDVDRRDHHRHRDGWRD